MKLVAQMNNYFQVFNYLKYIIQLRCQLFF